MAKSWFAAIEALTNGRLNRSNGSSGSDNSEPPVFTMAEYGPTPSRPTRNENPLFSIQEESSGEQHQHQEKNRNIRIQDIIDLCIDGYFRGSQGQTEGSSSSSPKPLLPRNVIGAHPASVAQPLEVEEGNVRCDEVVPAVISSPHGSDVKPNDSESWFINQTARAKVAAWKAQKLKQRSDAHQEPGARNSTALRTGLKRKLDNDECGCDDILASTSKRACIDHHYNENEVADLEKASSEAPEDEFENSDGMGSGNGDEVQETSSGAEDMYDDQQVPSGTEAEQVDEAESSFFEEVGDAEFNGADPVPTPTTSKAKEETPNKYQCKYCNETFKKKKKLKKHIRRFHNFRPDQETVTATPTPNSIKISKRGKRTIYGCTCTCCNRKFKNRSEVQDHQNTLKGIRAYSCLQCNASFFTHKVFLKHRKLHGNSENSRHRCSVCSKFFSSAQGLSNHTKTIHCASGMKKFQCQYCVQTFHFRQNLERHIQTHTKEPIKCDLCSETFLKEYHYRKHRTQVHNRGKVEYKCDLCSAKFDQRNRLTMHMKSHRGGQSSSS